MSIDKEAWFQILGEESENGHNPKPVFIYGTLMYLPTLSDVLGRRVLPNELRRGRLQGYKVMEAEEGGETYPVLEWWPGGEVDGLLYSPSRMELEALVKYEAPLYSLVPCTVLSGGKQVEAQLFLSQDLDSTDEEWDFAEHGKEAGRRGEHSPRSSKNSARSIQIDEQQCQEITAALMKRWRALCLTAPFPPLPSPPLPSPGKIKIVGQSELENVKGQKVSFRYGINFEPVGTSLPGAGLQGSTLYVTLPSNLEWTQVKQLYDHYKFPQRVYDFVYHELIHLADVSIKVPNVNTQSEHEYYNQKHELKAYLGNICSELKRYTQSLKAGLAYRMRTSPPAEMNKAFWNFLRVTDAWKQISPHLTEQNRKFIVKGAWTCFQEELENIGQLSDSSVAANKRGSRGV